MENTGWFKRIIRSKTMILLVIVVIIILIFYSLNQSYLSAGNIRAIMNIMSISGIISVGVACLLIGGGINLAAAAEGMFGGVLVSLLLREGVAWPLALLLVLIFGMVSGAINAFFVNGMNFMGFIATAAMASVYRGLGQVVTANQNVPITNQMFWRIGSGTVFNVIPVPFLILVILMLVYGFILAKTQFGRNIYLVGGNPNAARLSGLSPKRVKSILYINCGMISALAGAVLASIMRSGAATSVLGAELDAITAAVLGGVAFGGGAGSMVGCFVGLLMLNLFKNGLTVMNLQAYWSVISQGALLIIALMVDYINARSRENALKVKTAKTVKAAAKAKSG